MSPRPRCTCFQVQGAVADLAAAPLADRVEDAKSGLANSSILQLAQQQPANQSAEAATQERPSMAERFSHTYVSALPPVMQAGTCPCTVATPLCIASRYTGRHWRLLSAMT